MSERRVTIDITARERRTYERLRSRVVAGRPGEPSGFRDLVLLLPDFVVLLSRLARDPQVPPGAKLVAASAVAYVLSPIELLPELLLGPFGLIDDLLVVAAGVSFLVNRVHPDLVRAHWPGQEDALEWVQAVSSWAEQKLARGLVGLLGRLPRLVGY
jgi:uncharacterized membrane protein YkvA (DUF1232 family)